MQLSTKQQDQALWRYGIISRLLHRDPEGRSQVDVLEELAAKRWVSPDGSRRRWSVETLRKWLYRFQTGGLPALADQDRSRGTQIPKPLVDTLFQQRQHHPRWTTQRLLEACLQQGIWDGRSPSQATLYRFIKQHQLGRDPHRQPAPSRAFHFACFGQLWMADFLHGPRLREGRRRFKTYLHAILDDHSRYVVAASFSTHERIEAVITGLMTAVRRHGIPERFYVDNGAAYASRHLKILCARLGMQLIHTPPYRPQGRGKVERWFKTVRDQFLTDQAFASLDDLNQRFQTWLARYHESLHQTLGCSPLKKRLASPSRCREVPAVADIEALFRMERRCRVYKDGTIRLFRQTFEVAGCMPHSRVTVYFMPWDLDQVFYGKDMVPARKIDRHANAHRFQSPSSQGGSRVPDPS